MRRAWLLAAGLLLIAALAPAQDPQFQDIPEEDESLVTETEYTFNPIQAAKELKVGNFYWKKGSFRAAAGRFEEATKWDPGLAEAHFRLGIAKEKMAEKELVETKKQLALQEARTAYEKYLEIEPKGKHAKEARKHLAELPKS